MNVPSSGRIGLVRAHRPRTGFLLRPGLRPCASSSACPICSTGASWNRTAASACLAMGLRVVELDGTAVSRAVGYHRAVPALSLSDAFALALAHRTGCTLLTGDARLRRLATDEQVVCHGVLWLLDRMFQEHTAAPQQLYDGLILYPRPPRVAGFPQPKSTDASMRSSTLPGPLEPHWSPIRRRGRGRRNSAPCWPIASSSSRV